MILFKIIGRILGGLFAAIGRPILGLGRVARRHEGAVGVLVIVAIVAALVAVFMPNIPFRIVNIQDQASSMIAAPTVTPAPSPTPAPTATPAPQPAAASDVSVFNAPQVTDDFIRAEAAFDAQKLWQTLSPSYQQTLTGKGSDLNFFTQALANLKQKGQVMKKFQYIGGYALPDGSSFHFYIATFKDPTTGNDAFVPMSFMVDTAGKIGSFSTG